MTALACPRCQSPLPETASYGPCVPCRADLNAAAHTRAVEHAQRAQGAVEAGWAWDPGEGRHGDWIHPEGDPAMLGGFDA